MKFLQQFLGRRDPTRNKFLNRPQVPRLVMSPVVDAPAPREPALGHRQRRLRQGEYAALSQACLEAKPRDFVPQLLALLGRPVLHQVPGCV
jgi:hypothetical protein